MKLGIVIAISILVLSLLPMWQHQNLFGSERINFLEHFGGCWEGDIRLCDYNPFD